MEHRGQVGLVDVMVDRKRQRVSGVKDQCFC